MPEAHAFAMTEASGVGEARRAAAGLAASLDFPEAEAGKLALIVTEAAGNLVKHAHGGMLLLRPLERETVAGVEVLALDKGPGMADVARCLGDGFSTAGSPGTGLGAIFRLASTADVYSRPGSGTALVARLWAGSVPAGHFAAGVVNLPKSGELVCGDAWAVGHDGGRELFLVADGLGHGPDAAAAARAAVAAFRANIRLAPANLLEVLHRALKPTRGAAVAVAAVDTGAALVHYAGVGNIAGWILTPGVGRSLVSHNGTLGHEARKFQEFTYPFPSGATLVLASDGLGSRWDVAAYPGLLARDVSLIAGVLYRDFQRGRDDVTVLAARADGRPGA